MLNLGSKTLPSSQIYTIPSDFWNHAETLKQGHFLDLHVIVFVKNDRITISVPIILSINRWSLYHLKKCWTDNQIYILQLRTSSFFYKLLFEVKKIDVRLAVCFAATQHTSIRSQKFWPNFHFYSAHFLPSFLVKKNSSL